MKLRSMLGLMAVFSSQQLAPMRAAATEQEGVALAIVYDTSGSMRDPVKLRDGKSAPKSIIAERAFVAVVQRLRHYSAAGSGRVLQVGVYSFASDGTRTVVRLSPFKAADAAAWSGRLPPPGGGTPLGRAVQTATEAVLASNLSRQHVLVITDGQNTVGPDPAQILPALLSRAANQKQSLAVHFVAFDVDAKLFDPLKRLGVTVVGAANEAQLGEQLGLILEKQILLEEEVEPAPKPRTN